MHLMSEDDVRNVLAFDPTMIGSDGIPLPGKPHPRLAGTFARVLGPYCRDEELFGLSAAIRKMTSQPADRFGLKGRGRLGAGCMADLVLFDPATVGDRASFSEPLLPPDGVAWVFVNGQQAVADGEPTGQRPGRVLQAG